MGVDIARQGAVHSVIRTDASDAAARYANKRAEMWGFIRSG